VGKLILERNVNNFDAGFDVSGFSSGSYIVKINTVKGEVKKKLIIE
ncbi:MAG: T9SS type A sorting domain-containing protein, partial [Bacteroidales bacterium]|nr:T9SS type A sorting domain-containing protein [Bacteroidales bacterium]MBO7277261.1 T9SS type A sorting domain-containing protein [Bacteroidales bacterium]